MSAVTAFPNRDRASPLSPPSTLSIADIPTKTIFDYLDATGLSPELTEAEKTHFVSVCQAFGLSPWKREVYATVYGEGSYRRFSVITGYEVYLKRADRSGKLNGWSSRIEGTGNDMRAIVTVHRKDWSEPLVHEVYFVEAVQKKKDGSPTAFWTKQPRFQLKKVAISQGFHLAFPDELGGLPYDAAELPDAETITPATSVPSAEPSPPVQTSAPAKTLIRQVAVPQANTGQPEPSSIPSVAPTVVSERAFGPSDRFPDESVETLLGRLESYLEENYEAFTEKHTDWIFEKAKKSHDREGVLKVLGYAEKVVRNSAVVSASA